MLAADILLIEPDFLSQEILKKNLAVRNVNAACCEEGRRALQLIPKLRPDLVVLELELPDIPGLEVARRLRDSSAFADLPILAVTASAQRQWVEGALQLAFRGYLVKSETSIGEILETIIWHLSSVRTKNKSNLYF